MLWLSLGSWLQVNESTPASQVATRHIVVQDMGRLFGWFQPWFHFVMRMNPEMMFKGYPQSFQKNPPKPHFRSHFKGEPKEQRACLEKVVPNFEKHPYSTRAISFDRPRRPSIRRMPSFSLNLSKQLVRRLSLSWHTCWQRYECKGCDRLAQ